MGYQRYTKKFKDEAVKLCLESDANRRKIAENLGIKLGFQIEVQQFRFSH